MTKIQPMKSKAFRVNPKEKELRKEEKAIKKKKQNTKKRNVCGLKRGNFHVMRCFHLFIPKTKTKKTGIKQNVRESREVAWRKA
jgi:hypothetical protein